MGRVEHPSAERPARGKGTMSEPRGIVRKN